MEKYAIITAGGIGKRMSSDLPKQFLELQKKPILMHSIERFYQYTKDIKIIVSLPEQYIDYWKHLCNEKNFKIQHKIVKGGKTRFFSIKNALDVIEGSGIVAIHDGVRPLVSCETIKRTFEKAQKKGNAVASQDIFFSIRKIDKKKNYAEDRSIYKEIQTPQTFRIDLIKQAYKLKYEESFTDDASVLERMGESINLVEGNRENIKITAKEDLLLAEVLLDRIF